MAKIQMVKAQGRLSPLTEDDRRRVSKLEEGTIIEADVRLHRNPRFHRKFMAMMRYAYDHYVDAGSEDAIPLSFDEFRKEITKAAGYVSTHYLPDGSLRLDAKSLSFGEMEEDEFSRLYEDCCKWVLTYILKNWSHGDMERAVAEADDFREQFVG